MHGCPPISWSEHTAGCVAISVQPTDPTERALTSSVPAWFGPTFSTYISRPKPSPAADAGAILPIFSTGIAQSGHVSSPEVLAIAASVQTCPARTSSADGSTGLRSKPESVTRLGRMTSRGTSSHSRMLRISLREAKIDADETNRSDCSQRRAETPAACTTTHQVAGPPAARRPRRGRVQLWQGPRRAQPNGRARRALRDFPRGGQPDQMIGTSPPDSR